MSRTKDDQVVVLVDRQTIRTAALYSKSAENAVRGAFADGFRWVMLVCALLLFAGAAISFVELRPTARAPDDGTDADRSGDPLP